MCLVNEHFHKHKEVQLITSVVALLGKCLKDESEVLG